MQAYLNGFTIVPHDTNNLGHDVTGIYVGGAGNLVVETVSGVTLTFTAVPVGTIIPIRARKVKTSTATSLIGLY